MDLKEQLAETDRLLSESTALLELQEKLVANLREAGLSIKAADDLKAAFALSRQTLIEHKQELEQALRDPMTGFRHRRTDSVFCQDDSSANSAFLT